MPKTVATPKKFLELLSRTDAKWIKVKRVSEEVTKFKLRTAKYLHTLTVKQPKFTQLVLQSIPEGLEVIGISKEDIQSMFAF